MKNQTCKRKSYDVIKKGLERNKFMKKDFGMNLNFCFSSSWVKIKFSNNYVEQYVYTAYAHTLPETANSTVVIGIVSF